MIVKLLTERHLEIISLKGGSRGLSESTLVKMSSCWKSHAAAQYYILKTLPDRLQKKSVLFLIKTDFNPKINFIIKSG